MCLFFALEVFIEIFRIFFHRFSFPSQPSQPPPPLSPHLLIPLSFPSPPLFPLFPSSVSSNSHYFFLHLVHYLLFVYLSVYLFICLSSFFLLPPSFHPLQGDKEGKAAQEQYIRQETGHPSFQSMISKFDDTFNIQLKEFLERLWTDSHRHHPMLR